MSQIPPDPNVPGGPPVPPNPQGVPNQPGAPGVPGVPSPSYGQPPAPPSAYPSPQQGGFPQAPMPGPDPRGQYGPPGAGYGGPPQPGYPGGPYGQAGPRPFAVGEALSYGWSAFKQSPGTWIVLMLILFVASVGLSLLNPNSRFDTSGGGFEAYSSLAPEPTLMGLVSTILATIAAGVLGAVGIQAALRQTTGQPAQLGEAFKVNNMGNVVIFTAILAVVTGVVSTYIPILGLLVLAIDVLTMFAVLFIVDRNMSWIDGAKASVQVVTQNLGSVLLLVLAMLGINILGAIPCGLGLLITVPVSLIAIAYAYRLFTQQQVAPR